jgi:predicted lysophospholipase L1 biosynthesis ABC-type transport system permease subunit
MSSVYQVNKGINKAIEFRGLKAQYIGYLGGGLVGLLILYAVMYIIGVNTYICLVLIGGAGTGLLMTIFRLSHKYGQYGLLKKNAKRSLPVYLKFRSRKTFTYLTKQSNGKY